MFRSRATTQPLVYGQVSRPVTRQPNNAIRTNCRYVVRSSGGEREREEREKRTNESIGRNTQRQRQGERGAVIRTLVEQTNCTGTIERQSSGDIEKAIFVAGSRVTYETSQPHDRRVFRREKERTTDYYYIASSSRINIHERRSVNTLRAEEVTFVEIEPTTNYYHHAVRCRSNIRFFLNVYT